MTNIDITNILWRINKILKQQNKELEELYNDLRSRRINREEEL